MLQVEMAASVRNTSGKGPMRQLRMTGMTPAIVYGAGSEPQKLQLDTKILMAKLLEFYRRNTLVTLKVDGGTEKNVLIGEVQTDPVRDTLIHVDFCEIDLKKERAFNVPVNYNGVAKGVDLGGVMNVIQNDIVIEGKPLDIPDEFNVDVTALEIGDEIRCGQVPCPDNVRMVTDEQALAVSIIKPGAEPVEEEEEEVDGEAVEGAAAEEEPAAEE